MSPSLQRQLFYFSALISGVFLPAPSIAADDYGVISTLNSHFQLNSPTVTELKGRKLLFMSSANGIYSAKETKNGWTSPHVAFLKPGYVVTDPSIVMHPKTNQYFMFYTMRMASPLKKTITDKRTGKKTVVKEQAPSGIGVAYGVSCNNSPDGSGLCWNDISKDKQLIGASRKVPAGSSPSALISGTKAIVYYKADGPSGKIIRAKLDMRDWKIEETTPVTFQSFDPVKKSWSQGGERIHRGISNVDVKPYGKGYIMVGDDGSSHAISRWKSNNGLNFYYDPYDGNSPIIAGGSSDVKQPFVEPVSSNQFRVYYSFGDAESDCSKTRASYGNLSRCNTSIQVRLMSEEKNPKLFENFYFDEDYKKPDYNSVTPKEDLYTKYKKDPDKYKIVLPKNAPKPYKPPPEAMAQPKKEKGFLNRMLGM